MNRATHSPGLSRTTAEQRAKLLAAFDRSGLSAAAFARKHQINYTTFCGWRQRRDRAACTPEFVQIELPAISESSSLIVEAGAEIRLRICSPAQLELAVELLRRLTKEERC
jgi:transposase-like protein